MAACPADQCHAGLCALVELASMPTAHVFGVDEGYVYFSAEQGRSLFRTPKCGGATESLALSVSPFRVPTVSGKFVYFWLDGMAGASSANPPTLRRIPKEGAASETLAQPAGVVAIQPVGDDVYVADDTELSVLSTAGGGLHQVFDQAVGKLAGDDRYAYFHASTPTEGLFRIGQGQPSAEMLTAFQAFINIVSPPASSSDAVFIAYRSSADGPNNLYRVDKTSRASTQIAQLDAVPEVLLADERCVYSFHSETIPSKVRAGLFRVPATGGDPELIAASADGIAIDDTAYYFASGGRVFRRPK
jgi:hypothetical protein